MQAIPLVAVLAIAVSASVAFAKDTTGTSASKSNEKISQSQDVAVSTAAPAPDTRTNLDKISDPDSNIRRNAAIFLGSEKKKENVPALITLLNDTDSDVQRAAVDALALSGDRRAVQPLMDKFKATKDINIQMDIIIAIGELRNVAGLPLVRALLKDPYPVFRNEAVRALGKINSPETYKEIASMLNDESEGVRVVAAEVSGELKITSAAQLLVKNLQDPVAVVRISCARALGVVGGSAVVSDLRKLLQDTDSSVVAAAQESIKQIEKRSTRKTSK